MQRRPGKEATVEAKREARFLYLNGSFRFFELNFFLYFDLKVLDLNRKFFYFEMKVLNLSTESFRLILKFVNLS